MPSQPLPEVTVLPESEPPGPPQRRTRGPLRVLGVALLLGLLADVLFYSERLGISVPLFVAALVAGLFALTRTADPASRAGQAVRPVWTNLWLLGPLFFFAAMVALRADPFLTFLNLALSLVTLGLIASFFTAGRVHTQRLGVLLMAPFLAFVHAIARPARLFADVRRPDDAEDEKIRPRRLLPILRGLLLALPFLLIFGFLLASADLVFEQFMKDLLNFKIPPALLRLFWQALVVIAVAWLVAGAFAYALDRREAERFFLHNAARKAKDPLFTLGYIEAMTVLAAVDVMLLLFGWIQFTYLFGGEAALTAEGITYAEYARRGFAELVAVAVVSLGLILALYRVTRFETAKQERRFGVLTTLMIVLVLILLASAFQRLRLYEAAYGYTRLRLYAHVFIVWLGALLVWLPLTRWMRRLKPAWRISFGFGALVAAFLFTLTLDLFQPDVFIARQNLARFERTGKLDVRYLTWLSDDAVPVLADVLPRLEGREAALLREDLRQRQERLERRGATTGWPSYHVSRARALRAVSPEVVSSQVTR